MSRSRVRALLDTGQPYYLSLTSKYGSEEIGYIKTNEELNSALASVARLGTTSVRAHLGRNIMDDMTTNAAFTVNLKIN